MHSSFTEIGILYGDDKMVATHFNCVTKSLKLITKAILSFIGMVYSKTEYIHKI
jgi:hypothetical protein